MTHVKLAILLNLGVQSCLFKISGTLAEIKVLNGQNWAKFVRGNITQIFLGIKWDFEAKAGEEEI